MGGHTPHHSLTACGVTNAGVEFGPIPTCVARCRTHPSGCICLPGSNIDRAYMDTVLPAPFGRVCEFDRFHLALPALPQRRVCLVGPSPAYNPCYRPCLLCLDQDRPLQKSYHLGHRYHEKPNLQRRVAPLPAFASLSVMGARKCLVAGGLDNSLTEHGLLGREQAGS